MADTFLYFGYGSSLNQILVEFRVNEPVALLGKAFIKDYSFKFNKENPDGSARGNLVEEKGEKTFGLLYEIGIKKFDLLTQTDPFYDLENRVIETENGPKNAFVFICKTVCERIYPSEEYLNCLLEETRKNEFPEEYIQKIIAQAKAI